VFIDVDASADDDGEVERLPEGIAVLTGRWCAALNRMHNVKDFRPATREEVGAYLQRHNSVDRGRALGKHPVRRRPGECDTGCASLAAAILACRSARWLCCDHDRGPERHNGGEHQSKNEFCSWSPAALCIAAPVPIASVSNPKITTVIFIVPSKRQWSRTRIRYLSTDRRLLTNRHQFVTCQRLHWSAWRGGCPGDAAGANKTNNANFIGYGVLQRHLERRATQERTRCREAA
jgi:hypothetical protein